MIYESFLDHGRDTQSSDAAIVMFQTAVRNRLAKENVSDPAEIVSLMLTLIEKDDRVLTVREIRLLTGQVQLGVPWKALIKAF